MVPLISITPPYFGVGPFIKLLGSILAQASVDPSEVIFFSHPPYPLCGPRSRGFWVPGWDTPFNSPPAEVRGGGVRVENPAGL